MCEIGDAAANQSPLSFGGFGAMLRHLPRLVAGVDDALGCDRLCKGDLVLLQPYQPSLSAAWLFQRCVVLCKFHNTDEYGLFCHHETWVSNHASSFELRGSTTLPQIHEPQGGAAAAG